jgi:DNA-binding MarR family transcriptional regulator
VVIAHIGNVPVEEWLPFLVPVVLLYLYGRRQSRSRRRAVKRLPGPAAPLDEQTVARVLSRWAAAAHEQIAREQLPVLYPPGPDGSTAAQIAARTGIDASSVSRRLDELAELGYLETDDQADGQERRVWLTVEGFDLANITEEVLLESLDAGASPPGHDGARSVPADGSHH